MKLRRTGASSYCSSENDKTSIVCGANRKIDGEMQVHQALVAIGGRATRLRRAGLDIPLSKSFLPVAGRPLLYWCLLQLHRAGIRDVVLVGDKALQLYQAELILDQLPCRFEHVSLFEDKGLGVHGLPYQARELLRDVFLFECGHSFMNPTHYQRLMKLKKPGTIVFSAFERPHPSNLRQSVDLSGAWPRLVEPTQPGLAALAHPILLDLEYANDLPRLDFDIRNILLEYAGGRLKHVHSRMPAEFDEPEEMREALAFYERCVAEQRPLASLRLL